MKKLIIVGLVVAMAGIASASTFNWKTSASSATGPIRQPGSTKALDGGTAYLFVDGGQEALLQSFITSGKLDTSAALDSHTVSSEGKISAGTTTFNYGPAGVATTLTAYFAVVSTFGGQDYLYISDNVTAAGLAVGTRSLSYTATASSSRAAKEIAAGTTKAFDGAGWYTVPEPTSGLLLLLGMAGLALKRKHV